MKKYFGAILLIACLFLLASCDRTSTPGSASRTCKLDIHIFMRQGPDANHSVSGRVSFGNRTWSSFDGNLIEESGLADPVSFYFDGPAIHFILKLEQGRIFGTGIMESDLMTCSGSGGGTQSGPAEGDLGDWRGEWIQEASAAPAVQTSEQPQQTLVPDSGLCVSVLIVVFALFLSIWSSGILRPFKSRLAKSKHSNAALQKSRPDTRREARRDREFLTEYTATYSAEDTLFDLSFEIEKSTEYLGECGVTVAQKPGTDPTQATALEIWLFDARDTQTVSKILMSDFCYNDALLRSELEIKSQGLLIHPGKMIEMETGELRAEASVLQVEYETNASIPRGVFKRIVIRVTVWKKNNNAVNI